ncbi:MAG: hypothetical protein ACW97A_10955 [Candidatus Thorarchaeota archaeon]|jgi:hypothetical protein
MSRADSKKVQTQSTAEAIRMASASVLASKTSRGFPIGAATGSGSMMQENSETVAMSIAPLIFSIHDSLKSSEGLELLSLEWDLERTPGPAVLPEHLIIAGGLSRNISSHVCMLSWEKGVVDPFKLDAHMTTLSKKLADIEKTVINNEIDYETKGAAVLRRFADRLNSVVFVEMLDRQFQADWSSQQVKAEHVDCEVLLKMKVQDDFTALPPGTNILKRKEVQFIIPPSSEDKLLEHFRNRIVSPQALETLAMRVPETGRAILSELNKYAYSIEEVDIARSTITVLIEYLGDDKVSLSELFEIKGKTKQFMELIKEAIDVFEGIIEQHASSGSTLVLQEHKVKLNSLIDASPSLEEDLQRVFGKMLIEHMMTSIERQFPIVGEIRAYQLKGTMEYFHAFAKRVTEYLSDEMSQFLLVTSARNALFAALVDFRKSMSAQELDSTEDMLFHKFLAELYSLLNATFDRKAYEGSRQETPSQLIEIIINEMIESFARIDMWDLIGFVDVSSIARAEVGKRYTSETGATTELGPEGTALVELLSTFEMFVTETLPDVAGTFLTSANLSNILDIIQEEGITLVQAFEKILESESEKPSEWRKEAIFWIEKLKELDTESQDSSSTLVKFLNFAHERVGEGASAISIVERVRNAANEFEREYERAIGHWEDNCKAIEAENEPIREQNRRREELIPKAEAHYESEMAEHAKAMETYKRELTEHEAKSSLDPPVESSFPIKPDIPLSLESRIHAITEQYPEQSTKQLPEKPAQPEELENYTSLRSLLDEKLSNLNESQEAMERIFAERLQMLRSDGAGVAGGVSVSIGTEFLDYLMVYVIRGLGRLLPRTTRAYLRNPKRPDLTYLVTYECRGDELTVSIGSTFLRSE